MLARKSSGGCTNRVNGGNFVQQRVSLKWLNQTSDSLTYTSGDVCYENSPKCILTRVLDFSSDGSDIILTTEEDNCGLCRIAIVGTLVTMMAMRMKLHHQLQRMSGVIMGFTFKPGSELTGFRKTRLCFRQVNLT